MLRRFNKGKIGEFSFPDHWNEVVEILMRLRPFLPRIESEFLRTTSKHSAFYAAIVSDHDLDANNLPIHAWDEAEWNPATGFQIKPDGCTSTVDGDDFALPAYSASGETLDVGSVVFLVSGRKNDGSTLYWIVTPASGHTYAMIADGSLLSPNRWVYTASFVVPDVANPGKWIAPPSNPPEVVCYNRLEAGNTAQVVFPGIATASMQPSTLQPVFGGVVEIRSEGGVWQFAEENPWSPCT